MIKQNKIIPGIIFTVLLLGIASAAGIVSPYWQDYPLQMNLGDTKIVNFNLQNMVGSKDIAVEVNLKQGSNIATLEKTTYTAKAGTSDTMIPLTIKIPKNFDRQVQRIELEVKTVNPSTGGMVSIGAGWRSSFDVIVSQKEVSKSTLAWMILLLILVVIVLGVIIFVILSKRKKK
jgi:hypothetical protein